MLLKILADYSSAYSYCAIAIERFHNMRRELLLEVVGWHFSSLPVPYLARHWRRWSLAVSVRTSWGVSFLSCSGLKGAGANPSLVWDLLHQFTHLDRRERPPKSFAAFSPIPAPLTSLLACAEQQRPRRLSVVSVRRWPVP